MLKHKFTLALITSFVVRVAVGMDKWPVHVASLRLHICAGSEFAHARWLSETAFICWLSRYMDFKEKRLQGSPNFREISIHTGKDPPK